MKKKKSEKQNLQTKNEIKKPKYVSKNNNKLTVVGTVGYNVVSTSLPENFFEGLLIKEMELNNEFTKEKLLELVRQYSLAIEYYLQIDPMKAKAYQNRMEYLLTNKDTLIQLNKYKSGKVDENEKKEQFKNKKDFSQTKQYVKLKQEDLKLEDISKQVNTVLDKNNLKEQTKQSVKNLINNDIQKQNENWKEKIKLKKKKNLRNSYKDLGGSMFLSKKSGPKRDKFISKSILLKGKEKEKDDFNINQKNSGDIFDDLEEVNEEVYEKGGNNDINNNEEMKAKNSEKKMKIKKKN